MKKFLLSFIAIASIVGSVAYGQTATFTTSAANSNTPNADSVGGLVQPTGGPADNITASVPGGVTIKWKVIASNFPADWLTPTALGICDNNICYNNTNNSVWNPANFGSGTLFTSSRYRLDTPGLFHMQMDLSSATTPGTFYITCQLADSATTYKKSVTFIVSRWTTGVTTITQSQDDVTLYPNPATTQVNVIYDANAGVKTIAMYNIIGKVVKVYNTLDNSSARLDIDNIPSGIYFIRLMDAQGHIVATRKFTRQ